MSNVMDAFKATIKTGPGGWDCHCCGPSPKHRSAARQVARTRLKVVTRDLVEDARLDLVAEIQEQEARDQVDAKYWENYEAELSRDLWDDDPYEDLDPPFVNDPYPYDDSWEEDVSWPS